MSYFRHHRCRDQQSMVMAGSFIWIALGLSIRDVFQTFRFSRHLSGIWISFSRCFGSPIVYRLRPDMRRDVETRET